MIFKDQGAIAGLTMVQTLWYLTFTETIELSKARIFDQIQQDVKEGSIAYALCRPYSYNGFQLSRAMGEGVLRILPLMVEGALICLLLVGPLEGYWRALPFGVILIAGGILLHTAWGLVIGLLAFWTEEVTPFYWILQKLVFIAGGLFFPLDFYPAWLQNALKALPFAYAAYWPAITMVRFSGEVFLQALGGQLIYTALLLGAARLIFRGAIRKIHIQGG